jgi:putative ATPase
MNLFEERTKRILNKEAPLALRMRPRNLDEFVGQEEILGKGKLLHRAIEADRLSSLILYGPPGTGKTALAHIVANTTKSYFERLNAVTAGVEDIRTLIQGAKERRGMEGKKTILFIDEIHRFNKLQQEALLPDVEEGMVILIGTSIQNPYFAINSALLSRSQIFQLNSLNPEDIKIILERALKDKQRGLGKYKIRMEKEAFGHLVNNCEGDARRALNALELGALTTEPDKKGEIGFTLKVAEESIQKKAVLYDRKGDAHYDTISAFIKSMRGSDPDASLYWLAKMLYAGEDPRFIARRITICAAEDVGNADPQALVLANAALDALEFVGMPEAKIPLAQAAVYIACAPKSNAVYQGIERALKDVGEKRAMPVPKPLQNAHYPGAAKLGRGEGYKYPHDYKGHYVKQEYVLEKRVYYEPSNSGYEREIRKRMEKIEKMAR